MTTPTIHGDDATLVATRLSQHLGCRRDGLAWARSTCPHARLCICAAGVATWMSTRLMPWRRFRAGSDRSRAAGSACHKENCEQAGTRTTARTHVCDHANCIMAQQEQPILTGVAATRQCEHAAAPGPPPSARLHTRACAATGVCTGVRAAARAARVCNDWYVAGSHGVYDAWRRRLPRYTEHKLRRCKCIPANFLCSCI